MLLLLEKKEWVWVILLSFNFEWTSSHMALKINNSLGHVRLLTGAFLGQSVREYRKLMIGGEKGATKSDFEEYLLWL